MAERLTKAQVVKAAHAQKGFVTKIAQSLGVTAKTIYSYRDRYPDVADAIEEAREQRHDFVENKLMERINAGSDTAIIFYLKTQCKSRGFVERQEVTGRDGGPMATTGAQVHFYIPENGRD